MSARFAAGVADVFSSVDPDTQGHAAPILALLSSCFEVRWFSSQRRGQWAALVSPDSDVRTQFDLKRDCLVIGVASFLDFDQRALAQPVPSAIAERVDPGLRFLASADASADAAASAWSLTSKTSVVVLKDRSGDSEAVDTRAHLLKAVCTYAWRRDLFDEAAPVRSLDAFVGREAEAAEVAARLRSGAPVVVLGIRQVGKSSLLGRIEDILREDSSSLNTVATLSGSAARLKNGRWWALAQELLAAWQVQLSKTAEIAGTKIQVQVTSLRELLSKKISESGRLTAAFERDVVTLSKASRNIAGVTGRETSRLVFALDDCEQLLPDAVDAEHWRDDFFAFWNLVASTRQRLDLPGDLTYVIASARASGVEQGSLCGQANPLFGVRRCYLAPLERETSAVLMSSIGHRIGLNIGADACDRIFDLVGGHPLLLRRMGSALHVANTGRSSIVDVSVDMVTRVFRRNKRDFYGQVSWILDHFGRVAPMEERLLRDLALGGALAYEDSWSYDDLRETYAYSLERYGLVRFDGETPVLTLQLIRDSLHKPAAAELGEQKRQLRDLIDATEKAVRARISADVAKERTATEAVHAIVSAIPSDAKNRPLARQGLIDLGESAGVGAILEAMNWGDYEILLNKFYDDIEWHGPPLERGERLSSVKKMFAQAHLVRHNNDRELAELIRAEGFATVYSRFCDIRDMLSAWC